jgi:uncharacterized protein YjhX (UPF0386 family)
MTDTIMLEAPARGGRISDLADGQGRILRLHDLTRHHPSATPPMPTKPKAQRVQAGESRSNGSPMKVTDRP